MIKIHLTLGPFHLISTPPVLTNSVTIYPLRKKRSKCRHNSPSEINGFFLSPTEEDKFFLKPLRKSGKEQRERTHQPLRNDFPSPSEKLVNRGGGGVYIKWNGPYPANRASLLSSFILPACEQSLFRSFQEDRKRLCSRGNPTFVCVKHCYIEVK